jgi:Fic family protein
MARTVAAFVLSHPGSQISMIIDGLRKEAIDEGKPFTASRSTVYRWADLAVNMGLITRDGSTSSARYVATERQRIQWVKQQLSIPSSDRPKKFYNEDFLRSYEPNKTFYLSERNRTRLEQRCPVGSAPLSLLENHVVSVFLSDLSFWSSQLEGNEYDYASTIQLLEHKTSKHGIPESDRVMLLNHHDAVRRIIDETPHYKPGATAAIAASQSGGIGVRVFDLMGLHAMLSADLMKNPKHCGSLRQSHVEIDKSSYIPPDSADRIEALFESVVAVAAKIENPWEQALFLNVHIPYLQPFEDCNKRVARVACNIPLLRCGVTPMSWTDVTHRDYIDGIIGTYEFNDTALLAEVFTEGYLRSSERFSMLRRQGRPDKIAVEYRFETRKAVREMVLEGREFIPQDLPPDQIGNFISYVNTQLAALRESPANAPRFGIQPHELEQFFARTARNPAGVPTGQGDAAEDEEAEKSGIEVERRGG